MNQHIPFLSALLALAVLGLLWSQKDSVAVAPEKTKPVSVPPGSARALIDAADYPNLHAAVDAIPKEGGMLWIPPGIYEIDKPLWITTDNTRIQGAGPATHLINRNEKQQHALILEHMDRPKEPLARLSHVELADFRVSGNSKSGDGVFVEGVKELYIQGVTVDHHGEHGIRVLEAFDNPRIVSCSLHDNGFDGLYSLVSHDLLVSANQFANNRDGISVHRTTKLCINGNSINEHRRDSIVLEESSPAAISGNMIEKSAGKAIVIDKEFSGGSVSGNVFVDNQAGILLRGVSDTAISGNSFTGLKSHGVEANDCRRLLIVGNAFAKVPVAAIQLDGELSDSIVAQNLR